MKPMHALTYETSGQYNAARIGSDCCSPTLSRLNQLSERIVPIKFPSWGPVVPYFLNEGQDDCNLVLLSTQLESLLLHTVDMVIYATVRFYLCGQSNNEAI